MSRVAHNHIWLVNRKSTWYRREARLNRSQGSKRYTLFSVFVCVYRAICSVVPSRINRYPCSSSDRPFTFHRATVLSFTFTTFLQVAGDEGRKSTNPGVNTRLASLSTSASPRNDTDKRLGRVNNGATAVTLAGILATSSQTGTEHAVSDRSSRVVVAASGASNNGYINLAERGGSILAALGLVAPMK